MDRNNRFFIAGGLAAFLFYILLLFLLLLFFNSMQHAKHYVPKQTQSVEVSLMQLPPSRPKPKVPVAKKETKKEVKAKVPSVAKKAAPAPKHPVKAPPKAIASLFKGVKIKEPAQTRARRLANAPKIKYKPHAEKSEEPRKRAQELIKDINLSKPSITMRSRASGQGEVDAYMSELYKVLYGSWQPEALYAGSKATVRLSIEPDGTFSYRLLYPSDNQGFNESLIEYLDSLKRMKLPPHKKKRRLVIDVEFKAKE
ncbi:TonB C-terminal domain-containing protein [Hydrogenimonas sp. SS33]|uniref:TonB C-terminal domain-containing protein n=1 Tax=Hydrogenimonas leucolamina TaxID=2954236 RepID=UPI00336BC79F